MRDGTTVAIEAALAMHPAKLQLGTAGTPAGRPIAICFVDERTIENQQNLR
jgi:hypothetical protein